MKPFTYKILNIEGTKTLATGQVFAASAADAGRRAMRKVRPVFPINQISVQVKYAKNQKKLSI